MSPTWISLKLPEMSRNQKATNIGGQKKNSWVFCGRENENHPWALPFKHWVFQGLTCSNNHQLLYITPWKNEHVEPQVMKVDGSDWCSGFQLGDLFSFHVNFPGVPCLSAGSQWIMNMNRVPFIKKIEWIFYHHDFAEILRQPTSNKKSTKGS